MSRFKRSTLRFRRGRKSRSDLLPLRREAASAVGLAVMLLLAACSGAHERGRAQLARPAIDTLPNGTVSVMNPGPTRWTDTNGWRLVETGRIGGTDDSANSLTRPWSFALDGAGRLYVADAKPAVVKEFGSDNRLIRTIGREGSGPGEFRVAFIAAGDSAVVVHDPQSARATVFDTAGTLVRTWPSSCCFYASIALGQAGSVAVPTAGRAPKAGMSIGVAHYRLDGTPMDTVPVPQRAEEADFAGHSWRVHSDKGDMILPIPLLPGTAWAPLPSGAVAYGWNGDYRIAIARAGHDSAQIWSRTWTAEPVPEWWKDRRIARMADQSKNMFGEAALRDAFHKGDIPSTFPAFRVLYADPDGNLWVKLDGADTLTTRFDVFDSTGAYLGPVQVGADPERMGSWTFARGEAAAMGETEDGLPVVIRYRIEKPAP